ncbi:hypothetical protein LSAT2_003175 [Lamellibrachia satsuma]|nr:hypothetical protein LSAT2_003175 [Lamellibrachia satsuma]
MIQRRRSGGEWQHEPDESGAELSTNHTLSIAKPHEPAPLVEPAASTANNTSSTLHRPNVIRPRVYAAMKEEDTCTR